jgi:hypothetical protein
MVNLSKRTPNPAALILCIPLVAMVFAGCTTSAPTTNAGYDYPTAKAILAAYHPRQVHLFWVDVNETVTQPFPADESPQVYKSETFTLNVSKPPFTSPASKVLSADMLEALWLVQDNDTVILGTYHLHSNRHNIYDQVLAINSDGHPATITVGGIDYGIAVYGDYMAYGHFGPYGLSSQELTMPYWATGFARIPRTIDHDSIFPMWHNANGTVTFEHRHVNVTVNLRNLGPSIFEDDPHGLAQTQADSSILDRQLPLLAEQFTPRGRIGQFSHWCSGILKVGAPCMNPWEHPLV